MLENLGLYIKNNYGTCKLNKCQCKDTHNPRFGGSWVGTYCPDWQPIVANSWEELWNIMKLNLFKKQGE